MDNKLKSKEQYEILKENTSDVLNDLVSKRDDTNTTDKKYAILESLLSYILKYNYKNRCYF